MDFRLEVFLAVAAHLNLTKAALALSISQPAVTRHIQELESQYGVTLFNRNRRRISLTKEGELFLEYVRRIKKEYENLSRRIAFIDGNSLERRGTLRLGTTNSLSDYLLGKCVVDYSSHFSAVYFSIDTAAAESLFSKLRNNEVDIAIIDNPSAAAGEEIIRFPLFKYRLVPVVGHESFTIEPKAALYNYGEMVEQLKKGNNRITVRTDSIKNLVDIVSSGVNTVTLLPSYILEDLPSGCVNRCDNVLALSAFGNNLSDGFLEREYEVALFISKVKFRDELFGHFVSYLRKFLR